jgi:hypothetical protein
LYEKFVFEKYGEISGRKLVKYNEKKTGKAKFREGSMDITITVEKLNMGRS